MGAIKNLAIEAEEQAAWDLDLGLFPVSYDEFLVALGFLDNKLSKDLYRYYYLGEDQES